MDRDRRYGWGREDRGGHEDRGGDEERGGRGFGARDRDDDWRQRGGYFGGAGREDESGMGRGPFGSSRDEDWRREHGDRDFGMSGQAGRGYEGGGYSSRGWERDRDRFESSRSSGYGQMGLGNQGGWGSSRGLSGYGQRSSEQGSYGSTGPEGGHGSYLERGSRSYGQGSYDQGSSGAFGPGGGRDTSRESGPYGASRSPYGGYGASGGYGGTFARDWEPERGGWDRDRGRWDRDHGGGWEGGEQREGGMLHRMGEGLRSMFGRERGERGPFFGKGPKGYKRSDERVREEVCEVIARQGYIDASDVEVRVQNGEVTLSGHVRDRDHKRRLEQLIEDLPGVDDVKNEIRVQRMDFSQGTQGRTAGAPTGSSTMTSSEDNGGRSGRSRTS